MSGFEEWAAEQGIGKECLGYEELSDCWTAAQYALNSELGIAANEAAKAERLKQAERELYKMFTNGVWQGVTVRQILENAQG